MDIAPLVIAAAIALQSAAAPGTSGRQPDREREAVGAAIRAYRDAWLANDPAQVMATLAPDAVIYPSTLRPISGEAAIRQFWFPSSSSTRVTDMELIVESVHIDGDTAVASGIGSLTFVLSPNDSPTTQKSWHVNILRRQPDGSWRIWRRMWGDVR
jgi:uncharacterized protein (TIGR02246 family)